MRRLLIVLLLIAGGYWALTRSGAYLVVDDPKPSDVVVVLAGDVNDQRLAHGLELVRTGYGPQLQLDVLDVRFFGHNSSEYAARYLAEVDRPATICPFTLNSTFDEAAAAGQCLERLPTRPRTGLIVTHNFHTRRALAIFRKKLPQYQWSVAAVRDANIYDPHWWRRREWAKVNLLEWERLAWWTLVDQWR